MKRLPVLSFALSASLLFGSRVARADEVSPPHDVPGERGDIVPPQPPEDIDPPAVISQPPPPPEETEETAPPIRRDGPTEDEIKVPRHPEPPPPTDP